MRTILDNVAIVLKNLSDYEARANLMWASALTTSGVLSCGKENAWSLYASETIAEKLLHVDYREVVAVLM